MDLLFHICKTAKVAKDNRLLDASCPAEELFKENI